MKTMHSERDRQEILDRLSRLTPEARGKWGKMNAPQMVVHLTDAVRMATGELPVKMKKMALRYTPIKQLIIYVLPFPKGAPTARELTSRAPSDWAGERQKFAQALDVFVARDVKGAWPHHPAFGSLTGKDWGVLGYKHCDHHLRQFGV